MNDWDLRIFEAVARAGGMSRAAVSLNTVQSNVTTRLRLLEDELGVALFERHSRGVTLTAAGRRLRPYAARIDDLMRQAKHAVTDDGTPKGPLALGAMETTAALRLPALLARYAQAHPAVALSLTTGTSAELAAAVLDRRLDGAFVAGPAHHPDLTAELMFQEDLVLVTAPKVRGFDDLRSLADLRIIVFRAGCSYRQRLEGMLMAHGIVGVRMLEFGTLDAIIGCVAAGIGITLLPERVVNAAARTNAVATHAVPPAERRVDTVFIRRTGAPLSSALAAFLQAARPESLQRVAAE